MPLSVPNITTRAGKGSALTHAEADANFETLRDFSNSLATLLANALQADGTLKDNAVITDSILAKAVTRAKLAFNAGGFVARDTGSVNHLAITFDPYITAYENGNVFFIVVANTNTEPAKLKVADSNSTFLAEIPIRKLNNLELAAGDLIANSVICVVYDSVDAVFKLVSVSGGGSGTSGSTTTNFTGLSKYAPSDRALPGNGSAETYTHGLNAVPAQVIVNLKCVASEFGYVLGDTVPIDQFFNGGENPAFSVQVNATEIKVTQLTAAPEVMSAAGAGASAITTASWQINVVAYKLVDDSTTIFPALEVQVAQPDSGVGYGSNIYYANYIRNNAKSALNKLDMTNNNVSIAGTIHSPARAYFNMALLKRLSGVDNIVYTASTGLYCFDIAAGTEASLGAGGAWYNHKPVWLDEATTGNQSPSTPSVYCVQSVYGVGNSKSLEMRKLYYNGTAYTNSVVGSALDLHDTRIVNYAAFIAWYGTAASSVLMFAYNRVKRRIYVICNDTGLLHIFELASSDEDIAAWWAKADGVRYPLLTYVKAISIPGGGGYWSDYNREKYTVEFDTATGQEKSIVFSRAGNSALTGQIVRVPWKE